MPEYLFDYIQVFYDTYVLHGTGTLETGEQI